MKHINRRFSNEDKEKAIDHLLKEMEKGRSFRAIVREDKDKLRLPARNVFYDWMRKDKELPNRYALARELQADALFDELLDIADDGRNDTYVSDDGVALTNHEVLQRSRLRIDTRKWILSKMVPKTYGERVENKVDVTSKGESIKNTIEVEIVQSKEDE